MTSHDKKYLTIVVIVMILVSLSAIILLLSPGKENEADLTPVTKDDGQSVTENGISSNGDGTFDTPFLEDEDNELANSNVQIVLPDEPSIKEDSTGIKENHDDNQEEDEKPSDNEKPADINDSLGVNELPYDTLD